jgi:UDP-N-acetylglucosamine 2-epimerase (non-hydrolysing)
MKRILHIVGARPNFMKVAPVHRALDGRAEQALVHTGQHYDREMSEVFFSELELPTPDVNLRAGSGTHAVQTAQIMTRLEPVLLEFAPDLVLVYGDVNSTLAAAVVCSKLRIAIGHVEAGLRSRDRSMPEEINRLVTDQLADLLFTPSADANENLANEGIPPARVHFVGNVMIDTLVRLLPKAAAKDVRARLQVPDGFVLVTLHRPSNVDAPEMLDQMLDALETLGRRVPVVFPIHPRTRAHVEQLARPRTNGHVTFVEPLGYLDFLALQRDASVVVTDSGGVQEETTYLGIPCVTVRDTTERPVTVTCGTNVLAGTNPTRMVEHVMDRIESRSNARAVPTLWDGHAAQRIADILTGARP